MNNRIQRIFDICDSAATCEKCSHFNNSSYGMINYFRNKQVCLNIPSVWTDWVNRSNSKLMIIGQDWGPYKDMLKLNNKYNELVLTGADDTTAWKEIVDERESNTKQLLIEYIVKSAKEKNLNFDKSIIDSFYITNAVLCARDGQNYRGNENFKPKFCTDNCSEFLKKQIEFLKPTVIITLGFWPLYSISKSYNIPIYKTLNENISFYNLNRKKIINLSSNNEPMYVVPVFHPVAQIRKNVQIETYTLLWELLLDVYDTDELMEILLTYDNHRKEYVDEK